MPGASSFARGAIGPPGFDHDPNPSRLVESIGTPDFDGELIGFLYDVCGAEQVHEFRVTAGVPRVMATASIDGSGTAENQKAAYFSQEAWHFDQAMIDAESYASTRPKLAELDAKTTSVSELRQVLYLGQGIRSRLIVFGQASPGVLAFSMVRSDESGPIPALGLDRLGGVMDLTFFAVARHRELELLRRGTANVLRSLPKIERCLALAPERLPRREAEVAARILYGLCTDGIALDLNISQETVITYRKRVYDRLEIASFRELLNWYLRLHSVVGPLWDD